MKRYLIFVWGDVEPEIIGPFRSDAARDRRALELRKEEGDDHGIYILDVPKRGAPDVNAYSGAFFMDAEDEG
jgi:hypothetical protein